MLALLMAMVAGAAAPPELPAAWLGNWAGTLRLGAEGKTEVKMELRVRSTDRPGAWTWTIVYGEGEKRQERKYELLAGTEAGRFVIDEKNGLKLHARLAGPALVSVFRVKDQLLTSRYELRGDSLQFEIVAVDLTKGEKQQPIGQADLAVESYATPTYQRAELKRGK